jgi:GTP-binding protein Era
MMLQVKSALEDADVAILMHDITQPLEEFETIANSLKLKVPALLLLNKTDTVKDKSTIEGIIKQFKEKYPTWEVLAISARKLTNTDKIMPLILKALPEGMPFYPEDSISDRNERFFVAEMVREQIFALYDEEIPYHTAVLIQSFEEKTTLNVIKADIIVSRETQKMILLGKGGSMIKQLGINARKVMEEFLQKKVHLELFVKVRPKWRDNENYLREYGYNS